MKHEETYYTCDRCGVRIPDNEIDAFTFISRKRQVPIHIATTYVEKEGYLTKEFISLPNVETMIMEQYTGVIEYYRKNHADLYLCPKCAKEFKKFMKEKKND